MRFRTGHHRERSLLVDLTPMIDVVFLLIVFFLTTAQFARMTRADVDLPVERGEGIERADEPGITINLLADGTIVVDDNSIDLDGLRRIIEEEIQTKYGGDGSRAKLLLRADRRLAAARVNQIVRLLQNLGVDLGRFATEIPR